MESFQNCQLWFLETAALFVSLLLFHLFTYWSIKLQNNNNKCNQHAQAWATLIDPCEHYLTVGSINTDVFWRVSCWLTAQCVQGSGCWESKGTESPSVLLNMIIIVLGAQMCSTLCHPMDWRLPGSSVHGILQCLLLILLLLSCFSHIRLCATP